MKRYAISLEDFAVDPQLGAFPEASPAQRLVFRLLDGLPPANAEQFELFETLAARKWGEDLRDPRKVVALVLGADSGKSLTAAMALVHRALFGSLQGLRPGQKAFCRLVAPDQRLARIPLDYAIGIVENSPAIQDELARAPLSESIEFTRGTVIDIRAATRGGSALRGQRYLLCVLEEAAFFRDSDFRVNDADIYQAVKPRILLGGLILLISTPWRKSGLLYDLHAKEHGRSERFLVLQGDTRVMRPDKIAEVEEAFEDDAETARVELGAEFADAASSLFQAEDVEACVDTDVERRPPLPGWRYVAAMDPSGLRNDAWAFTILGRQVDQPGQVLQFVTRAWLARSASVRDIVNEIGSELAVFGLRSVLTDQYGSEVTAEHFTNAGIRVEERPFTAGPSSPKATGFRSLKQLFAAMAIRLLDDAVQTRELKLLEVTRLSGGGERIAAPGRLHDDRACALALATSEIHSLAPGAGLLTFMRRQAAEAQGVSVAALDRRNEDRPTEKQQRYWDSSIVNREPTTGVN